MLAFGNRDLDLPYRLRPGAYALVFDDAGRVALVHEDGAWHLPGGGIEAGETPEVALQREVQEECACRARILEPIGEAREFVDRSEQGPLEVHAHFFRARFVGEPRASWHAVAEASALVARRSHAWAIERAAR